MGSFQNRWMSFVSCQVLAAPQQGRLSVSPWQARRDPGWQRQARPGALSSVDGWPGKTVVHNRLWEIAEQYTP